VDTVNFAKTMASLVGAMSGGGTQAVSIASMTGGNAAENNYLKHAEALRLGKLLSKQALGQCDSSCDRDIKDLKALDKIRNERLAACDGVASASCDATRQDVRTTAADYIRRNNTTGTLDLVNTYVQEKSEAILLAGNTINGKAFGAVEGVVGTFVEGAIALDKLVMNVSGSAFGDTQSQLNLREGAGAAYDALKDPNNWPVLLGAMSTTDREKLAQAYERGDGKTIGQLMGAQLANLPIGGGGALGTIKKIDKVVVGVEDASKLAKTFPTSPVDIAHTVGADYNAKTGRVTGGHSLLNEDVKVLDVVSQPDVNGVYVAKVQMRTPDGTWVNKVSNGGENTMFPKNWDAPKIQAEIDSAWADPQKVSCPPVRNTSPINLNPVFNGIDLLPRR
jgi:hypothetical protein